MTDSDEPGRDGVLSRRRREILQAIGEYAASHGCSPTTRDIARAAGLKSPSSVLHHLRELKAAGFVSYEAGSPRTMRLLRPGERTVASARADAGPAARGSPKVSWVPIAGQVRAGEPILPLESSGARIPLPRQVVGPEEGLFILKVVGDSMTGAGILPGDWVVMRELFEKPKDGDIVAALIDGAEVEGTVKTYRKRDRRVWLMPQNPAYPPIPGDKAIIRGKVVAVLRGIGQGLLLS